MSRCARRCPRTSLRVLECQPKSLRVWFSISNLHPFTGLTPMSYFRYFLETHFSLVLVLDSAIAEPSCSLLLFHFLSLFEAFSTALVYSASFEGVGHFSLVSVLNSATAGSACLLLFHLRVHCCSTSASLFNRSVLGAWYL